MNMSAFLRFAGVVRLPPAAFCAPNVFSDVQGPDPVEVNEKFDASRTDTSGRPCRPS